MKIIISGYFSSGDDSLKFEKAISSKNISEILSVMGWNQGGSVEGEYPLDKKGWSNRDYTGR